MTQIKCRNLNSHEGKLYAVVTVTLRNLCPISSHASITLVNIYFLKLKKKIKKRVFPRVQ